MTRVRSRLNVAETASRRRKPVLRPWHIIVQDVDQSWGEALAACGL